MKGTRKILYLNVIIMLVSLSKRSKQYSALISLHRGVVVNLLVPNTHAQHKEYNTLFATE